MSRKFWFHIGFRKYCSIYSLCLTCCLTGSISVFSKAEWSSEQWRDWSPNYCMYDLWQTILPFWDHFFICKTSLNDDRTDYVQMHSLQQKLHACWRPTFCPTLRHRLRMWMPLQTALPWVWSSVDVGISQVFPILAPQLMYSYFLCTDERPGRQLSAD